MAERPRELLDIEIAPAMREIGKAIEGIYELCDKHGYTFVGGVAKDGDTRQQGVMFFGGDPDTAMTVALHLPGHVMQRTEEADRG